MNRIKFWLNGCDISFVAEAPEDITLKDLLKQCNRIKPHWCACGICSLDKDEEYFETDIIIDYKGVKKAKDDVSCSIKDSDVDE